MFKRHFNSLFTNFNNLPFLKKTKDYNQVILDLAKFPKNEVVNKQIQLAKQAQQVVEQKRVLDFETYRFMKITYAESTLLKPYETQYLTSILQKEDISDEDYCFLVLNNLEDDIYFKFEVEKYLDAIYNKIQFVEQCKIEKLFLKE